MSTFDQKPAAGADAPMQSATTSASDAHGARPWARAASLSVLAIVLVWLVTKHTLPAYLSATDPEQALRLNPSQPVALVRLAERKLAELRTAIKPKAGTDASTQPPTVGPEQAPALGEIRGLLERAATTSPLNANSFGLLAEVAELNGEEQRSLALSKAAMRRSLRESPSIYRLLLASFAAKDYPRALQYADALMRARPAATAIVAPIFARMAETPEARDGLNALLATNPPWRMRIFEHIQASVTDARTPLDLYLALKDTANPPTVHDLRNYFVLLFRHNFHDLAYYAWLQFLPPEHLARAGLLFNGNFAFEPSGLPFDWVIKVGTGATAQIRPQPDAEKGNALEIELGSGQVQFGEVSQTVMLAPGKYTLHGSFKGEISGRRGLRWRVHCLTGNTPLIGETPMVLGTTPKWKEFEAVVSVPATDCRAQKLQLVLDARSASEQLVSGTIWYKDLAIRRHPTTP